MRWSDEQQAQLERLAAEGLTGTEIGQRLGLTRAAILGRAHRTGVKLTLTPEKRLAGHAKSARSRTGKPMPRKLSADDVCTIRACIGQGMKSASLARIFGVSPELIRGIKVGYAWSHVPAKPSQEAA